MNPIYQMLMQNTPANAAASFFQRFMQFKNGFTGNAQEQVQTLLRSGNVTQEQYNAAVAKANELFKMMPR